MVKRERFINIWYELVCGVSGGGKKSSLFLVDKFNACIINIIAFLINQTPVHTERSTLVYVHEKDR